MTKREPSRIFPAGDTFLGSAAARALEAERRRLGVVEGPGDWTEIWGRRLGRFLAYAAVAALGVSLLIAYGG